MYVLQRSVTLFYFFFRWVKNPGPSTFLLDDKLRVKRTGPHSAVGSASDLRARGPGFDTRSGNIPSFSPSTDSRRAVDSYWREYMHLVLVDCLGGLSLPRNAVVRLTSRHGHSFSPWTTINNTQHKERQRPLSLGNVSIRLNSCTDSMSGCAAMDSVL